MVIKNIMLSEDYINYIRRLAHSYWIAEGKPNGDEYRDSKFGRLKVKRIHWLRAEAEAEAALNHSPGSDW